MSMMNQMQRLLLRNSKVHRRLSSTAAIINDSSLYDDDRVSDVNQHYPHMFQPLDLGPDIGTLPNRVIMGSMHTGLEGHSIPRLMLPLLNADDDHTDLTEMACYFAERAKGGVGLMGKDYFRSYLFCSWSFRKTQRKFISFLSPLQSQEEFRPIGKDGWGHLQVNSPPKQNVIVTKLSLTWYTLSKYHPMDPMKLKRQEFAFKCYTLVVMDIILSLSRLVRPKVPSLHFKRKNCQRAM